METARNVYPWLNVWIFSLLLLPDGYKLFLKHHKYHLTHIYDALSILHHPKCPRKQEQESHFASSNRESNRHKSAHALIWNGFEIILRFVCTFSALIQWWPTLVPLQRIRTQRVLRWFQSLDYELWSFNWRLNFVQVNCVMHQPVNLPLLHSVDAMNQA